MKDGVYEVLKVMEKTPIHLKEHVRRFRESLKKKDIKLAESDQEIMERTHQFIKDSQKSKSIIRWVATKDGKGKGGFLTMDEIVLREPNERERQEGIRVKTLQKERKNPTVKNISQSYKHLLEEPEYQGIFELLLYDREGFIREGTRSNAFFLIGHALHTAPAQSVLPGITRTHVMAICRRLGVKVVEDFVSVRDLAQVTGAFLTGTAINVLKIRQIDDRILPESPALLDTLMKEYDKDLQKEIEGLE